MDMHVPETGDQEPAFTVDLASSAPSRGDFRVVANSDDAIAVRRDGLIRANAGVLDIHDRYMADEHISFLSRRSLKREEEYSRTQGNASNDHVRPFLIGCGSASHVCGSTWGSQADVTGLT
jgi:hypothetical protein